MKLRNEIFILRGNSCLSKKDDSIAFDIFATRCSEVFQDEKSTLEKDVDDMLLRKESFESLSRIMKGSKMQLPQTSVV